MVRLVVLGLVAIVIALPSVPMEREYIVTWLALACAHTPV